MRIGPRGRTSLNAHHVTGGSMDGTRQQQTRITNDDPARVLDATDIVRLIGDVVQLKPKGREHVCLCPFHDDRNPSMYVVPNKQIFYCFVCGAGGNAFEFVKRYHNMNFREALEMLAERAGITLTPWQGKSQSTDTTETPGVDRADIAHANQQALTFFRGILNHKEHGTTARNIIENRGISSEMVETFLIGAAPDKFDGLEQWAKKKGHDLSHFEAAGLLKCREDGSHYDALRHRLIFPILDQMGRAIAFGGRILNPDDVPKYLNSPETPLFAKGSTLYGLWQARTALRDTRHAIVTEGYTDVIACHQAGICNVVASLGTALTQRHAQVLRRMVDRVTLLFDGDEAGQRAADRAADVFFAEPIDVRIAVIEDGNDPDDLLKGERGVEAFHALIEAADDATAFRITRLSQKLTANDHATGSMARTQIIEQEAIRLVELGLNTLSPMRRQTMIRHLARLAGVDERAVCTEIVHAERRLREARARAAQHAQDGSEALIADHPPVSVGPLPSADWLLGCLLIEPKLAAEHTPEGEDNASWAPSLAQVGDALQKSAYGSDPLKAIRARVATALTEGRGESVSEMLLTCEDEAQRRALTALATRVELETAGDKDRLQTLFHDVARQCAREKHSEHTTSRDADAIARQLEAIGERHRALGGDPLAVARKAPG